MDEPTGNLLDRFQGGERAAYGVLFERYRAPLERFIQSHTGAELQRHIGVEDLVQETHVEALRSLSRFAYRRELSFFLWLCGIARRLVYNRCRALRQRPPAVSYRIPRPGSASSLDLLAAIQSPQPSPEDALTLRENLDLLGLALTQLPAAARHAVLLRYVEGHDSEESARILGITPIAFRVRVSRGLVRLHDVLSELLGERPPQHE